LQLLNLGFKIAQINNLDRSGRVCRVRWRYSPRGLGMVHTGLGYCSELRLLLCAGRGLL